MGRSRGFLAERHQKPIGVFPRSRSPLPSMNSTPSLVWEFGPAPVADSVRYNRAFRDWHKAQSLGMSVERLAIGSRITSPEELKMLNLWIQAGGAWRASALPHWDGSTVLCNVLHGYCPVLPIGRAGGGRATRAPVLPLCWYEPESLKGKSMENTLTSCKYFCFPHG